QAGKLCPILTHPGMIDNVHISALQRTVPRLVIVKGAERQRAVIDRKRNYFFAKRAFDILFSAVFILGVLSWLLPLMALLIKLTSRGPVFFLQKRIGRGGRSFTCYKLRTMYVNAGSDTQQAAEKDERVTSAGWFLRESNIDEFPQFLNVLQGSMSVVGPRPHMYADCRYFGSVVPGYKFRNMVRPGLTGLAQVKGYHGPTTSDDSILMRSKWDNYYIRNIGWMLDCTIVFRTIFQRMSAIAKFLFERRSEPAVHTLDDITAQ
ncbi:MAG: hypothetical protein JWQ78_2053, partial [Sediminibacterium sp.]|nr:hypothetical protein [Sediminibacterium sp.]